MVVAHVWRQIEIGGQKGGAKLADELFHGVTFVAKPLAPEIAVEARLVASPVTVMPISA